MKLVTAIIKPFKLDDVRAALSEIGISDRGEGLRAPARPHRAVPRG